MEKKISSIVEIDGSYLEGGGQILRNALSLSSILRRPIRIINIRSNRPNPGLSNQHLYGLNLLQQITGAQVRGNVIKSTEVEFNPGEIKSGSYDVDTRTAASISLILQAAFPVLLFGRSESQLEVIGGTNVGMAPQVDYMTEVLRPNLELFGVSFDFDLLRRGYYPKGGGRCIVTVPPVHRIEAADITQFGTLTEVCGWCFVAGKMPLRLAQDMKHAAEQALRNSIQQELYIEAYKESANIARDNGSGLVLKAVSSKRCTVGSAGLGEKQVDARALGLKAGIELGEYIKRGTCVDRYVQDQLIIFMALGTGVSRILTCDLTNHTRTAIHVAELIAGVNFCVTEADEGHVIISCEGIGCRNTKYAPI